MFVAPSYAGDLLTRERHARCGSWSTSATILRYISLSLLESMDSDVLLQTIRMHGKTDTIHADFGTNFCGAKSDLEEKDSFDLDEMR